MQKLRKLIASGVAGLSSAAFLIAPAGAAPNYSLFGDASLISPGNDSETAVQLVSEDFGFGSVEFEFADGLTFAELTELGTDFNITDDNCGGGSPRFSVTVDQGGSGKNIFVYLGDAPSYNTCTPDTWETSGDLLESGLTVDTGQLGGTFYHEYDDAVADFGTLEVTQISLVTDAGWSQADGEQTVLADNVMINSETFTFELTVPLSKDECKQGGWQDFDGMFKNQGDCVSYVTTGGQNTGAGQ